MNSKQVLTFVLGAVLAAGAMFLIMKPKQAAAPEIAQTSAPSATTFEPPVSPSANVQATPEPVPTAPSPVRVPERRAAARPGVSQHPEHGTSSAKPAPAATPSTNPAPVQTTPTQTANNGPILATGTTPAADGPPRFENHSEPAPAPKREPKTVTVPSGTLLAVRVDERLSTQTHHSGDSFRATLDQPLVIDGFVLAERGARIEGRVAESDPGGRVRGTARLALELVRLSTSDGQRVKLQTQNFAKEAESGRKGDAAKIGAAAGIGAAIGAIAGGGRGAAIGAAAGGAAGTGGVMATRGSSAEVAPETRMSFRLSEPITITERLR